MGFLARPWDVLDRLISSLIDIISPLVFDFLAHFKRAFTGGREGRLRRLRSGRENKKLVIEQTAAIRLYMRLTSWVRCTACTAAAGR